MHSLLHLFAPSDIYTAPPDDYAGADLSGLTIDYTRCCVVDTYSNCGLRKRYALGSTCGVVKRRDYHGRQSQYTYERNELKTSWAMGWAASEDT